MKNAKLTLLVRAKMSILNAIRNHGDTSADPYFRQALLWIDRSIRYTNEGTGGAEAAMMNAAVHLQDAAKLLGFSPVQVQC